MSTAVNPPSGEADATVTSGLGRAETASRMWMVKFPACWNESMARESSVLLEVGKEKDSTMLSSYVDACDWAMVSVAPLTQQTVNKYTKANRDMVEVVIMM